MKKWWLLGVGVLLIGGAVYGYYAWKKEEVPPAAPVATTQVRKGMLEVSVSGAGSIQVGDRQSVTASKQGTVKEVKMKENGLINKGDVILILEGEDNSDQIQSSEIELEKKQLELTDLEDRYELETEEKSIANLELSIKKQKLDITQTRNSIKTMKEKQAEITIVAPITGTVKSLAVAAGDSISPQTQIAEIVDYANLKMVVSVDELDIPKVKLDQEASISVEALTNEPFSGKVTAIADEGTASNGVASFDVTLSLKATPELKVGMSAEASIEVEKKENTLLLPIDTVQSMGGRYIVMLPPVEGQADSAATGGDATGQADKSGKASTDESGKSAQTPQGQASKGTSALQQQARSVAGAAGRNAGRFGNGTPHQVEVGIHNEDFIEIVSGLKEGDKVVIPTVVSGSTTNAQQGGFGGMGGLGGAGFGGAGFGGAGGAGGGAGFSGGGGGRTGGTRTQTQTSGGGR